MVTATVQDKRTDLGPVNYASSRGRRVVVALIYLSALAGLVYLFADGWSYYTTALAERPFHEDYRALRPAGSRGLIYGIIGASMMILMLIYTLQKRLKILGRIPLRPFLDIHIFFGVIGPLFIVLHTSFKVQGLVSISFWSMVAVALSGYLGRYLYQQIPRHLDDRELSLGEIDTLHNRLTEELSRRSGQSHEQVAGLLGRFEDAYTARATGTIRLLVGLVMRDLLRPFKKRSLRRTLRRMKGLSPREADRIVRLASRRALLKRRMQVLGKVEKLFHYWHVIHKPFAIIMYVIMIVHIAVAVWTGYGWIG